MSAGIVDVVVGNIIFVIENIDGPDKYVYDIMAIAYIIYITMTEMFKIKTNLVGSDERLFYLLYSNFTLNTILFFFQSR